jgi:outer membrane protein assembly factor BamE (lipoprotein component of BamABCDE complex)
MKRFLSMSAAGVILLTLTGCLASHHAQSVRAGQDGDRLTVGTVQREIHVGMSGSRVIEVLGSPNVVTTDQQRREVWVYDKIATESVRSDSSGSITTLILGAPNTVVAGGRGDSTYGSGASSTSQRTFTVIIKFDENKHVRDFAYHTTRF